MADYAVDPAARARVDRDTRDTTCSSCNDLRKILAQQYEEIARLTKEVERVKAINIGNAHAAEDEGMDREEIIVHLEQTITALTARAEAAEAALKAKT